MRGQHRVLSLPSSDKVDRRVAPCGLGMASRHPRVLSHSMLLSGLLNGTNSRNTRGRSSDLIKIIPSKHCQAGREIRREGAPDPEYVQVVHPGSVRWAKGAGRGGRHVAVSRSLEASQHNIIEVPYLPADTTSPRSRASTFSSFPPPLSPSFT